jgi:Flp pilus assembly protein TadG
MNAAARFPAGGLDRDERGLALLEFALLLPLLLLLLAIVIDLCFCYNARLNTLRGITAGALYAFEKGGTVTSANAEQLRTTIADIVRQGAGSTPPTVTVLVNNVAGASAADSFYCTSGSPTQWRASGPTSTACGDQTMSAKFITIRTAGTYQSRVPIISLGAQIFPLSDIIVVRAR